MRKYPPITKDFHNVICRLGIQALQNSNKQSYPLAFMELIGQTAMRNCNSPEETLESIHKSVTQQFRQSQTVGAIDKAGNSKNLVSMYAAEVGKLDSDVSTEAEIANTFGASDSQPTEDEHLKQLMKYIAIETGGLATATSPSPEPLEHEPLMEMFQDGNN